jgi:hypothetical protein
MTIIRWMRRTTTGRCRIWVKTGPDDPEAGLPKYPRKQTFLASGMSQTCQILASRPIQLMIGSAINSE